MYIVNGIAYACNHTEKIKVVKVEALDDMMLLLTFNTAEKKLYDAQPLLEYPAFKPLENEEIFKTAKVENGVVIWLEGEIDIAPETLYKSSYAYSQVL